MSKWRAAGVAFAAGFVLAAVAAPAVAAILPPEERGAFPMAFGSFGLWSTGTVPAVSVLPATPPAAPASTPPWFNATPAPQAQPAPPVAASPPAGPLVLAGGGIDRADPWDAHRADPRVVAIVPVSQLTLDDVDPWDPARTPLAAGGSTDLQLDGTDPWK